MCWNSFAKVTEQVYNHYGFMKSNFILNYIDVFLNIKFCFTSSYFSEIFMKDSYKSPFVSIYKMKRALKTDENKNTNL